MPYQIKDEPELEAAITGAIQLYAANKGHSFTNMVPKANQQGDKLRRFCADVVGVLNRTSILLLELKVLDCKVGELVRFEQPQYLSYLRFERHGVPVAYAYNREPSLAYHENQEMPAWPMQTLMAVNRSIPSRLPGRYPQIQAHESLWDWLEYSAKDTAGEQTTERLFGQTLGFAMQPGHLRNGVLALIYMVDRKELCALDDKALRKVYNLISQRSTLGQREASQLKRILASADDLIRAFSPTGSPQGSQPSRPGSGPRP